MLKRLSAIAIKPVSYPALLGLLLVLLTLCAFGTSVNATPDEIKFVGTALRQEANIGVLSWVVRVDQLLSGPAFCPSPLEVIVGGGVLPVGYVDPSVTVGDRVEVYGELQMLLWDSAEGGGVICTVFLSQRYHYFKKSAGPDPCQLDSDRDGVPDCRDRCANTPPGSRVDDFGCPVIDPCQVDSDRDGVPDCRDRCANTPPGTRVDDFGCPMQDPCQVDSDRDGVPDCRDHCVTLPGPPPTGCPPSQNQPPQIIVFDINPPAISLGQPVVAVGAAIDPEGGPLSYQWNMGDGTIGNTETLAHIYQAPGTYQVCLTVRDNQGATAQKCGSVTVQGVRPPQDRDGDGLPDDQDRCPDQPGPRENNGCPDPCQVDSDRDGVPDCRDRCANTLPGTRVDEYGCPPSQPSQYNVIVQVYDAATGGRIGGATVALDGNWAATTNSNGEATITVSPGSHEIAAWKEGYDWATIQSYIDHDTTIRILLKRHVGDSDGDGLPDDQDRCPNEPGPRENNGCPIKCPELRINVTTDKSVYQVGEPVAITIQVYVDGVLGGGRKGYVSLNEVILHNPETISLIHLTDAFTEINPGVFRGTWQAQGPATWGLTAKASVMCNCGPACDRVVTAESSINIHVQSASKPDLIIEDITWSPEQPAENDTVTINVKVKNEGAGEARKFYVSLYSDSTYYDKRKIKGLGAGSITTVTFKEKARKLAWLQQCSVDHTLRAIADSEKQVEESDENNNEYTKTIRIRCKPEGPDIPETTVVLDSSTIQVMTDVTANEVRFSASTPLLDRLKTGDIIVCGVTDKTPYGLLRKIEGISRTYGVTLKTTQAKLVDAIKRGSISVTHQLKPDDMVNTTGVAGEKIHLYPQAQAGDIILSLEVDLCKKEDDCGVTATGELTISPKFFFDLRIDWGEIKHVSFHTTITQQTDLGVKVEAINVGLIEASTELLNPPKYFHPITIFIGPVPVVLVPALTVTVGVEGNVTGGISVGIKQVGTFKAGMSYDNGVWSTTKDYSIEFTPYVDYSLEGTIKGFVKPRLNLLLYGVDGPYVGVEGYLEFNTDLLKRTWKLCSGLDVGGGVGFSVLGHNASFTIKLIAYLSCTEGTKPSAGSFSASNFSCASLGGGRHRCSLTYDNQLGETAQVLFLFKNSATGEVVGSAQAEASQGTGTASADFNCPANQPGTYKVSWKAYKASDKNLTDPVAWSKSTEQQEVQCGAQPGKTGCIKGSVLNEEGLPIPDVLVEVSGPGSGSNKTNSRGKYKVDNLPVGSGYMVSITKAPGYKIPSPKTGISVKEGTCTTVDEFRLQREEKPSERKKGCISGRVTDEQGQPIDGAKVVVFSSSNQKRETAKTKDGGNYLIEDLPAGEDYTVSVQAKNYESPSPQLGINVEEGKCTTDVNFQLRPSSSLLPDLQISKLTVEPKMICRGEVGGVKFVVKNSGRKFAPRYEVGFYLSSSRDDTSSIPFNQYMIDGTLAGKSEEYSFALPRSVTQGLAPGKYYIVAYADVLGIVREKDESNNIESAELKVLSCVAKSNVAVIKATCSFDTNPNCLVKAEDIKVAEIQIEIFDLSGKKVFSQEALGNTLKLRPISNQGRPLANGVYLYVVHVRGYDGREYISEIRKLVIVR